MLVPYGRYNAGEYRKRKGERVFYWCNEKRGLRGTRHVLSFAVVLWYALPRSFQKPQKPRIEHQISDWAFDAPGSGWRYLNSSYSAIQKLPELQEFSRGCVLLMSLDATEKI